MKSAIQVLFAASLIAVLIDSVSSRSTKVCPGVGHPDFEGMEHIDERNVHSFITCTIINGSVIINSESFNGDVYLGTRGIRGWDLQSFSEVTEITGYLRVSATRDMTDLSAFRSLRVIGGQRVTYGKFALAVFGTSLKALNLTSLREISRGGVTITRNAAMCFVSEEMWDGILKDPIGDEPIQINDNRFKAACTAEGNLCHSQCTDAGCWGPSNEDCIECKNYRIGDRCLQECSPDESLYAISDSECDYCHDECQGGCSGPGPKACFACKHLQYGDACVDLCPVMMYSDEARQCQLCHENCVLGCTGPINSLGPGGCDKCVKAITKSDYTVEECMPTNSRDSNCPVGYFYEYVSSTAKYNFPTGMLVCRQCDEGCSECTGGGVSLPNCTKCAGFRLGIECVDTCPDGTYADLAYDADQNPTCQQCHKECNGTCYGGTVYDCVSCANLMVYDDGGNVACVAECPGGYCQSTVNSKICEKCPTEAPSSTIGLAKPGATTDKAFVAYPPPASSREESFWKMDLKLILILVEGAAIVILLIILLIVCIVCTSSRKGLYRPKEPDGKETSGEGGVLYTAVPTKDEEKIPGSPIKNEIGSTPPKYDNRDIAMQELSPHLQKPRDIYDQRGIAYSSKHPNRNEPMTYVSHEDEELRSPTPAEWNTGSRNSPGVPDRSSSPGTPAASSYGQRCQAGGPFHKDIYRIVPESSRGSSRTSSEDELNHHHLLRRKRSSNQSSTADSTALAPIANININPCEELQYEDEFETPVSTVGSGSRHCGTEDSGLDTGSVRSWGNEGATAATQEPGGRQQPTSPQPQPPSSPPATFGTFGRGGSPNPPQRLKSPLVNSDYQPPLKALLTEYYNNNSRAESNDTDEGTSV